MFYYDYNNCTSCKFKKISTPVNLACPRLISFLRLYVIQFIRSRWKGSFSSERSNIPPLGTGHSLWPKGGGEKLENFGYVITKFTFLLSIHN